MAHELLLDCAWKGTLILLVAAGLDLALQRASAAARHLVWTAAYLALLLLPALSLAVPRWTAPAAAPPRLTAAAISPARIPEPAPDGAHPRRDWIVIAWLAGAALALARFGAGTARVWFLVRKARPIEIGGAAGRVTTLDSGPGTMPLAWGLFRPVILLPSEARDWPAARLRATLVHELAHVERGDCLTLAMTEITLALYWFQPLAWWAAGRMRRERERACDDRVLQAGVAASDYASDLVAIARGRDTMFAAPAMARASHLEARLRAILDPAIRRGVVSAGMAGVAASVALLVLLPLAGLRLSAQSAGLSGVVYDASGAVIPEATVSVFNAEGAHPQTIVSGAVGSYAFSTLQAGQYQVMISHPGFAVFVRKNVQVPGRLDAILSMGQIAESVTVSGKGVAAAPASAPRRIRVGGNVQAAKLLDAPKPLYPATAAAAGMHGTVLLQAVVTMGGTISGLSVLSSPDPALADAAMESVRQWRYQPTLLNGQPVEVVTSISVNFRLDP